MDKLDVLAALASLAVLAVFSVVTVLAVLDAYVVLDVLSVLTQSFDRLTIPRARQDQLELLISNFDHRQTTTDRLQTDYNRHRYFFFCLDLM